MAELVSYGVSTGTSLQTSIASTQYRKPNPWLASTMTWTEIVSSTPEDWAGIEVSCKDSAETIYWFAVGAASSEVIIGAVNGHDGSTSRDVIPVPIPAGSRVSFAAVSWTVQQAYVSIMGLKSTGFPADPPFTIMEMGPLYLDGSGGDWVTKKLLTAPGSNNTKSAWTEISYSGTYSSANNAINGDSLDQAYDYLGVRLATPYYGHASVMGYLVDIGYGSGGSETVWVENLAFTKVVNSTFCGYHDDTLWFPWGRAAGDRIAMRYQCADITKDGGVYARLFGLR